MFAARWILSLWPGLPQLWWRGTWQSMSIAVAFSALLNGALLTTFVEGVAWSPWLRIGLWVCVIMTSLAACAMRVFDQTEVVSRESQREREAAFALAQLQYMKGHWFEAEKQARWLLGTEPHDTEARLLLASILRRSGRSSEATKQLTRLAKSVDSFPWQLEIEQELAWLVEANKVSAEPETAEEGETEKPVTLAFPGKAA